MWHVAEITQDRPIHVHVPKGNVAEFQKLELPYIYSQRHLHKYLQGSTQNPCPPNLPKMMTRPPPHPQ